MQPTHFGVQLVAPLPAFDGLVQDRLLIRIGHPQAVTLHRDLPAEYGVILKAMEQGLFLPVNPLQRLEELVAIMGELAEPHREPLAGLPPCSRGGHLRRLK